MVNSIQHHWKKISFALGLAGAVLLICWSWQSTPQLADDEEVFKTVDAMFTALTTRDLQRLADTRQRLDKLYESGRMSEQTADRLDALALQAEAGEWEPAAKDLYAFMLAQRRDEKSP